MESAQMTRFWNELPHETQVGLLKKKLSIYEPSQTEVFLTVLFDSELWLPLLLRRVKSCVGERVLPRI